MAPPVRRRGGSAGRAAGPGGGGDDKHRSRMTAGRGVAPTGWAGGATGWKVLRVLGMWVVGARDSAAVYTLIVWGNAAPLVGCFCLSATVRSATRFSFDWGCLPAPCMRRACAAAAGPSLTPLRAHPSRTSFSTLKSDPSSPAHRLRATMLSVELGARSCDLLGCPPHLRPTARKLRGQTRSPRLATGQTSSVSSRTAFCSPMSP